MDRRYSSWMKYSFLGLFLMSSVLNVYLFQLARKPVHFLPNEHLNLNRETAIPAIFATYTKQQESKNKKNRTDNFILLESYSSNGSLYSESNKARLDTKLENTKNNSLVVPLLTMFSSWPQNDTKFIERINTLKDWAYLKPYVKCVFFYTNGTNVSQIKSYGWDVLQTSKTSLSGIPVLKNMFLDAMAKYSSVFYGYANGDILFDVGILQTLRAIALAHWRHQKPFLIVGRRTNVLNVKKLQRDDFLSLRSLAKNGKLFRYDAEDYFITDSSFPWSSIPGVVIGRPAYDNWLVQYACKNKYHVIDATKTVLAVHQTTKAGNNEGKTHDDANFNIRLLKKSFKRVKYTAGTILCAPWFTESGGNVTVRISKRTQLIKGCFKQ